MAEPLTDARQAMWQAIRNWPATRSAFKRQFDFDSESAAVVSPKPSPSDFPLISIFPTSVDPRWWVYSAQEWTYALKVEIWVKDWILTPAEQLVRAVVAAVFRSSTNPNDANVAPYVEAQIGRLPVFGPLSFERTFVEQDGDDEPIKAILAELTFLLKIERNPLTD